MLSEVSGEEADLPECAAGVPGRVGRKAHYSSFWEFLLFLEDCFVAALLCCNPNFKPTFTQLYILVMYCLKVDYFFLCEMIDLKVINI